MEFLWQEGHTAHATEQEAIEETRLILDIYADFAESYMAMPVIKGLKTEAERFAGAVDTYCIEALMQDGKALQAGTSHFLGQNFARAFDCTFQNQNNELEHVWATSWGVSTRLIGALVMTHSDDRGLVLPPRLAPTQTVIVPIYRKEEDRSAVLEASESLRARLTDLGIRVKLDAREGHRPGWKFTEYEVQGVPVRIAVGPRDVENGTCEIARRDTGEKETVPAEGAAPRVQTLLGTIQDDLFSRAATFRSEMTATADTYEEFRQVLDDRGGFVLAHWDGTSETEALIKNETGATIRCIPLGRASEQGVDMVTGAPSDGRVLFARAY
jgi:prolyl-tRNA synthetase